VKELVEQEGKRTVWLLRVLLRTWPVRFLIVIFYVTCCVIRLLSRVYIIFLQLKYSLKHLQVALS
jgi:hypothetical protein